MKSLIISFFLTCVAMIRENKGFTLGELLIVFMIAIMAIGSIGTIAVGIMAVVENRDSLSEGKPDISMHRYVETLRPDLSDVRVVCSVRVVSLNGYVYVRCTATGVNSSEARETLIAECNEGGCAPIANVDR